MRRRISVIICSILAGVLILTGCGNSSSDNTYQIKNSTVTGTVKSIDGDKITLTLETGGANAGGGMPGSDMVQGGQTPPERPEGESADGQTPPDMPEQDENTQDNSGSDEEAESNNEPDSEEQADRAVTIVMTITDTSVLEDADGKEASLSDISEGDTLTVTIGESGNITKIVVGEENSQGQSGQASGAPQSYSAVNTYTEDTTVSGDEITSTGKDESATLTENDATVTLDKVAVTRDNDESTGGDSASFYGVGAAVLTTDGTTIVKDSQITSDANGGAGVFSYGENSTSYVSGTTIKTSQGASGGVHVAGGGTLYAWDNTVETDGGSSAAIRSDRGGGTMVVDGGSYTSNGSGSPAVYCTADITVNDAKLTSTASEGICIEGKNALRLYDCDLTSSQTENEQNDNIWNLIVYQSMSGDAEDGEGTLILDGGSITAKEGGIIYTTNTQSVITLSDVEINYPENTDYFLRCTGNANKRGWGSTGSNGADCTFTADDQQMKGDIIYDSISDLDFYMVNGSKLTGAFIDDESCAGNGGDGSCNVVIDADSTWVVTGDSTVTSLSGEGKIVDADGKTVTIKGADGTVYVKGDSQYTVTVTDYSDKADTSGAGKTGSFSDYEVEKA